MSAMYDTAFVLPAESSSLSTVVSEAFVRFFVEIVGHYSLFMGGGERDDDSASASSSPSPTPSSFQREPFRKAVVSKSLRRFLEVFMETQMFAGFVQEREHRRQGLKGVSLFFAHYSTNGVPRRLPCEMYDGST